jgi:tetratricopeptide (TPR) repeat protein
LKYRSSFFSAALLCLVLAVQASAAEADKFKAAEEWLDAWHIGQAEEFAAQALKENGKSAPALDLDARVKFYQGRYNEALTVLDRALAIESTNPRRQALKLFTQFTVDVHKNLRRHESAHFVLFVDDKRDGILVAHALETLEKTYQAVGAELGYFPKEKVRVEIAPDAPSFNAISTLSLRDIEETGAVGICKFNKLMIISPRALSFGYRWLDSLSH